MFIEVGYRIDMRIESSVLVENKTMEKILPIHLAQLLTSLKLRGLSLGLIISWNMILLQGGIQPWRAWGSWRFGFRAGKGHKLALVLPWGTVFVVLVVVTAARTVPCLISMANLVT